MIQVTVPLEGGGGGGGGWLDMGGGGGRQSIGLCITVRRDCRPGGGGHTDPHGHGAHGARGGHLQMILSSVCRVCHGVGEGGRCGGGMRLALDLHPT